MKTTAIVLLAATLAFPSFAQTKLKPGVPVVQITPEKREFATLLSRSSYYRAHATSWRSVDDQLRADGVAHTVTELSCPDKYHTVLTGPVSTERFVIGTHLYDRVGTKKWRTATLKPPIAVFSPCTASVSDTNDTPDSRVGNIMQQFLRAKVEKRNVLEFEHMKCQLFVVTLQGSQVPSKFCFSTEGDPYLIYSEQAGARSTSYDFNKPVAIRPPKM